MTALPIRVVKVGCSLFERPNLIRDLRQWLATQSPALHILVTGAGPLADSIKTWQPRFGASDAQSHWLCIDLLSITAKILQQGMPEFPLLTHFADLQFAIVAAREAEQPKTLVFDVQPFLCDIEPTVQPEPLPHSWDVSSDSIAARLAEVINADELVLLKARPCPEEQVDFAALSADHYVDQYFPSIAPRVRKIRLFQLPW
jgi:aspartokinase-like uncharacterized kinase